MRSPPEALLEVPAHGSAPFVGASKRHIAGSPTSHSALPTPLPFPIHPGDCAPVCQKANGRRSSRNRTFVQIWNSRSSRSAS